MRFLALSAFLAGLTAISWLSGASASGQIATTSTNGSLVAPGIPNGPYEVGFRFEVLHDVTREYRRTPDGALEAGGRPIALSLWYPAVVRAATARLSVRDYLAFGNEGPVDARELRDQFAARLGGDASADAVTALMNRTLQAGINVAPARHGPLILFAHATPAAQAVMAEFLASYGFVVAGITSRDAVAGLYRVSVANLQGMGSDLQFVMAALANRALVTAGRPRPVVIGMSNGALGAIAFEVLHGPLAGIVSLDGTVGERLAAQVIPQFGGSSSSTLTSPLLHLYTPDNSYLDLTELRSQPRSQCELGEVPGAAHGDFLSDAVFRTTLRPDDPSAMAAMRRFAWVSRRTLEFILRAFQLGKAPAAVIAEDATGPTDLRIRACRL